jgi:hypothetical protein
LGFIVFQPYETLDEVCANFKFLIDLKKLFRVGILLEPVRVVPNTAFHKMLLRDGLVEYGLGHQKLTYGYRYKHPDVGWLHAGIKELLGVKLGKCMYNYEYFCTTAGLYSDLAIRDDCFDKQAEKLMAELEALKERSMLALFKYLSDSIDLIKKGGDHELIGCVRYNKEFIDNFIPLYEDIRIKHALLVGRIANNGGSHIIKEIYSGLETI